MKHIQLFTNTDKEIFDRIDRDCFAMHIAPPPKTFIELSVKDNSGIELERYTDRSHSWVRNGYNKWIQLFMGAITGTTYASASLACKDTDGSALNTIDGYSQTFTASAADNEFSILIGTGTAAESFEAYKLQTKILEGNTTGKMSHAACAAPTTNFNSDTKKWSIVFSRVFNNNSGGSIVVSEIGMVAKAWTAANNYRMICRDLLVTGITVPNAGQLTVLYTMEMTYPE